jgi:zinc finger protein
LKKVIACDEPYTVVLDDPLANSYIQNPYAPDVDEQLTDEKYTRSWDQNEDLGLNDINVDNYSTDPELQQQQPQQQQQQQQQ